MIYECSEKIKQKMQARILYVVKVSVSETESCVLSYFIQKIKLFEILKNRRCILAKAYKYYLLFWGFQVLLLIILLLILWNLFQNSWKQKPFSSFRLTCKLQICQDIDVKLLDENFHKIVSKLTILRFEVFLIRILLLNDGDKVFYNWGLKNSLVKRIRCFHFTMMTIFCFCGRTHITFFFA